MTIILPELLQCGVCEELNEFYVTMSTSSYGSPDLDTRPPEMARSLIYNMIQRCNSCGYCAFDISKCKKKTKDIVRSKLYQDILNDKALPTEAASYMALSHENSEYREFSKAAWNLIHSAWVCDDSQKPKMAILLRKNSLESIAMAEAKGQKISDQDGASEAIKIDLYRRSEQFSEALVLCKSMGDTDCDDVMRKIINFQISLIHKKDTSAHTVSEALDVK